MLIIGQPDKMHREQRNGKGYREITATLMEILVSGKSHNVSNLMISLYMSDSLATVQDTAMSMLYCSPSQLFLLRQP